MASTLLINPRRRKARKARRKNPSAAQLRARAKFAAAARARARNPIGARRKARRRNPVGAVGAVGMSRRRRRNPIGAVGAYRRRRRNPTVNINTAAILATVKEAAVLGAGAVVADIAYTKLTEYLPDQVKPYFVAGPGQLTVGSALKMAGTIALGQLLSRSTGGMSRKAALGAAVVQARDIVANLVPAGLMSGRVGYATPATRVVPWNNRVSPNSVPDPTVGAYAPGPTPLLQGVGAYVPGTPLLNGRQSARAREGVRWR